MFIINLYRVLFGYVILKIYGEFPERILNLCAKNRISVWNVHKKGSYIELCVMIKDFKKFRRVRAKSGVRVKIIKKCGLRIVLSRYKLRFGILLGLTLFFAILKLLSSFVWNIEVVGAKSISEQEVKVLCKTQGIYIGQYIKNIDTVISKEKILLDSDKLAWASLNVEGSKITVNITEVKAQKPEFTPSNIIANSDAVIKEIKVLSGNSQVVVGQAVQKGELLISGTVDVGDRVNFTRAAGEILGETEEKIIINKAFIQHRKRYTGNSKNKTVIEFFGFKLPLYLGKTQGDFTKTYSKSQFKFLGEDMPVALHNKRFDFYEIYNQELSRDELIKQIESEFDNELLRRDLQNVTVESREILQDETSITVEYTVKHIKNICVEENLLISTLN